MRLAAQLVAGLAAAAVGVLAWGYWNAARHADVQLQVNDHGLASRTQLYGTPHDVTLVLRDASGAALATARSVEPAGYLLAVHPDPAIGNCQHIARQPKYGECYGRYSAWLAGRRAATVLRVHRLDR